MYIKYVQCEKDRKRKMFIKIYQLGKKKYPYPYEIKSVSRKFFFLIIALITYKNIE